MSVSPVNGSVVGLSEKPLTTSTPAVFEVNTSTYSVVEAPKKGWREKTNTCQNIVVNQTNLTPSCTITNEAIMPKITLKKELVGSQYGDSTLASDFLLLLNGNPITQNAPQIVSPGSYSIGESVIEGYVFNDILGEGCPAQLGASFQLNYGDDITCTVRNRAEQPRLTLCEDRVQQQWRFYKVEPI